MPTIQPLDVLIENTLMACLFGESYQINEGTSVISGKAEGSFHFPDRDGTVDDIIEEWSKRVQVPCIKEFPYSHRDRRCVLPIGKKVLLDADSCVLSVS